MTEIGSRMSESLRILYLISDVGPLTSTSDFGLLFVFSFYAPIAKNFFHRHAR